MDTKDAWSIPGRYGRLVSQQANDHGWSNAEGMFDVWDATGPRPQLVTGKALGCIGLRYALYWIANYGQQGKTYTCTRRHDGRMFVVTL